MAWRRLTVFSVILGTLATVLVAWACALWSPVFSTAQFQSVAYVPADVRARVPPTWHVPTLPSANVDEMYNRTEGLGIQIWACRAWESLPLAPQVPSHELQDARAGWPFMALRYVCVSDASPVPRESSGDGLPAPQWLLPQDRTSYVNLGIPANSGGTPSRCYLPLRPTLIGFAANVLTYSAAVFLAALVPGFVTRWRRTIRGRCPSCGYDRTGLEKRALCPECGKLNHLLP